MTDLERSIHAQVQHLGSHQRTAMLRLAAGKRVNKQTIASLTSKGWVELDEYESITLTAEGGIAVRMIHQEMKP